MHLSVLGWICGSSGHRLLYMYHVIKKSCRSAFPTSHLIGGTISTQVHILAVHFELYALLITVITAAFCNIGTTLATCSAFIFLCKLATRTRVSSVRVYTSHWRVEALYTCRTRVLSTLLSASTCNTILTVMISTLHDAIYCTESRSNPTIGTRWLQIHVNVRYAVTSTQCNQCSTYRYPC